MTKQRTSSGAHEPDPEAETAMLVDAFFSALGKRFPDEPTLVERVGGVGPVARRPGPLAMNQVATGATSSNPARILENLKFSDARANMASLSERQWMRRSAVHATADDTRPTPTHVLVSGLEIREERVASGWAWLG